MYVKSFNF